MLRCCTTGKNEATPMLQKAPAPDADGAPPRHATMATAAQLIIADIIGIGILSMAQAYAELGWVLAISLTLLLLPLNLYCGILTWEAQVYLYPGSLNMAELGRKSMGPVGYWVVAVTVYSFIFGMLGDYILSVGLSLEQFFYTARLPRAVWSLFGVLSLLPFCQLRTLNATRWLLWLNLLMIVACVAIALGYLIGGGTPTVGGTGDTAAVSTGMTWRTMIAGTSKLAFAYSGQFMYPEITSEMVEPRDFPRALYYSAPWQVGGYLLVGSVGYAYLGSNAKGLLINALPRGTLSASAASLTLFLHMIITYLIKGTVLARAVHRLVAPHSVNDYGAAGTLTWLGITSAILAVCYGVASAVPFFDDLISLLGALQTPMAGFIFPVLFVACTYDAPGGPLLLSRALSMGRKVAFAAILLIGAIFVLVGTTSTTIDLIESWEKDPPTQNK